MRVGIENILSVSFTVGEIKSLDVWHRDEEADDSFVGLDVSHGLFRVDGVGMDAELAIDKAFNAGLEAIFETIFAGSNAVIECAAG